MSECGLYCSHGGYCDLPTDHSGLHSSSGLCNFTTEEAISKQEADAKVRKIMEEDGFYSEMEIRKVLGEGPE